MAIKSLKNKISNLASGEILGETDKEREEKESAKKERSPKVKKERPKKEKAPKPKKEKVAKPKRERKPKEKKQRSTSSLKDNLFRRRNVEPEEPEVEVKKEESPEESPIEPINEGSVEGYEDVLSILGIKENIDVDADFSSSHLDYIEFSQATPLGFDFQEVTDFISRVKYTLNKYESALNQRNKDLITVASEVKKVEQRMVEASQAKELERMVGGMTEEERLIEENLDLNIELNELKNKLIATGQDGDIVQIKRQNEILSAENEMLKSGIFPANEANNDELPTLNETPTIEPKDNNDEFSGMPDLDEYEGEMPSLDSVESESKDPLDDMISDLGGMYDEER